MSHIGRSAAKGVFAAADLLLRPMPGPRILIYHQIAAGLGRQMEVTLEAFTHHLDWLTAHGEVVDLDEALNRRGDADAHRVFVLTFDDGYEDLYHLAFPRLRARGLPFLLYLTTAPVEQRLALTPGGSAEPLTWSQATEMLDSGLMTIGAHTHTHIDLRGIDSTTAARELDTCNDLIELRLGLRPRHFAYPWGYWDARADAEVRARYDTATLGSGRPVTADTDVHLVNRVPVQLADGRWFFERKMRTGLRMEDRVRRWTSRYAGP